VRSLVGTNWNGSKRAVRAYKDMQAHLTKHSFPELLRYEIRHDLEQVPDDQREWIVRDIYRCLLGTTHRGQFTLGDADSRGLYTIDEALGSISMYQLWRSSSRCGYRDCLHH
jgi:hypothetical protein